MASYHSQTNFTGGVISPRLFGRVDLDQYMNSVEELMNFNIHPHGGITSRSGTRFVSEVKFHDKEATLIPFEHSVINTYALEFGDKYMRVKKDGGSLETSSGVPYEIVTPYGHDEVKDLSYCQTANVMYLVHEKHKPHILYRIADDDWHLEEATLNGMPTEWTAGNYPTVVMFFEQRLIFAGVPDQPQRLWGSRTGKYHDFAPGATAEEDDPIDFTIVAEQANPIVWMQPSKELAIGTSSGEWLLSGTQLQPLSPKSIEVKRQTSVGSASAIACAVDNAILFISRTGKNIREMSFSYEDNSYISPNLTLLSEHLTRQNRFVKIAFQQDPNSCLWCLMADGRISCLTYMKDQQIAGWGTHTTDGDFKDLCCVPAEKSNDMYFIVERVVGGIKKKYVEFLVEEFVGSNVAEAYCVDCGVTYKDLVNQAQTISGLDHLEGEDVAILADGKVHRPLVVTNGEIILDYPANIIHVGLQFTSRVMTLKLESLFQEGSTQGKHKKITDVVIMFDSTIGGEIGADWNEMYPILFNDDQLYGVQNALFSGSKLATIDGGWSREASVYIHQDEPLPMTINALTFLYEIS